MQRSGGAVVADIGGQPAFERGRIDPGEVRALVDVAALAQHLQEIGSRHEGGSGGIGGHAGFRSDGLAARDGVDAT